MKIYKHIVYSLEEDWVSPQVARQMLEEDFDDSNSSAYTVEDPTVAGEIPEAEYDAMSFEERKAAVERIR